MSEIQLPQYGGGPAGGTAPLGRDGGLTGPVTDKGSGSTDVVAESCVSEVTVADSGSEGADEVGGPDGSGSSDEADGSDGSG